MPSFTPDSLTGPTGTVQQYVIPLSADYRLDLYGAQGGGINGGKGAHVGGVIPLAIGDKLFIVVGQRPNGVSAGGGATLVATGATLATATVLMVAAGGGGCGNLAHVDATDGRVPTYPATAVNASPGQGASGTAGGTGGNCAADAAAA
ncbi:MAG: hypothetical protein IMZ54_01535, partial [Acidobacteria bacterium]|nr:hypothetical protein [Acidobacteriota bacterium]